MMNSDNQDLDSVLRAIRNDDLSDEQVRQSGEKMWRSLQSGAAAQLQTDIIHGCEDVRAILPEYSAGNLSPQRAALVGAHLRECATCRSVVVGREALTRVQWAAPAAPAPARQWPRLALAMAALVLIVSGFIIHNLYFAVPAGARASVQSVDGMVFRVSSDGERVVQVGEEIAQGDVLRTAAGAHAFLKLQDGSLVEVNERTDFTIEARGKNTTVALERGAVLVQAAKRKVGHLYVNTPDCRVAVTGTVFSVNSGIKGSRVSVVEGTVQVEHGGADDVLHAGDQVTTSENMAAVPVEQDIAWSRELTKHLELLAQFSKLQRRLEQVNLPGPRYNSALMERMPADALVYASLPNAGQALEEANRILQEQIAQSPALRQWWTHGDPKAEAKFNQAITRIRELSDYLGDEIVVVGFGDPTPGAAVVAEVRRSGLREFLQTGFKDLEGGDHIVTIGAGDLTSIGPRKDAMFALVRDNEVIFSGSRTTLEHVNAQLNQGQSSFQASEFGRRVAEAYSRGAGFLLAADLHRVIANDMRRAKQGRAHHDPSLDRSGFKDMRYLVVEHRELNGTPENRMVLDFTRERGGIASWLAAPAPMGSLEFVSRNASLAVSVISKEPEMILADIIRMTSNSAREQAEIAEEEAKLNLRFREDLAAHFGGDIVLALDGPVLPTPSWKMVVEVHDPQALTVSIQKIINGFDSDARRKGLPSLTLQTEDANGQRYYAIRSGESGVKMTYFTFSSGYMIVGPSRAVLMNALRTRATGDSLARSGDFKALLPKDQNANYSAIAYQHLAPVMQPLLGQLTGEQAKIVQELAADSRPSVIAAWGGQDRIEAVTNSRLIGLDWLALATLLDGTTHRKNP